MVVWVAFLYTLNADTILMSSRKLLHLIVEDKPLLKRCKPNRLSGDYAAFWECHISSDLQLIC